MHPTHLRPLFGVALLAAAGSAMAGFTDLPTFDKPLYFPLDKAVLTVPGLSLCKNIEINWGDGTTKKIDSYDFSANQNKLVVDHQYTSAGNFGVTVKTILGPTLAEQCGSRSTSANVASPGKLTKVYASAPSVEKGKPVDLIVEGLGVCPADSVIRVTPAAGGASQTVSAVFAKDAPWPRKVNFVPDTVGAFYISHSLAPGQNVAATAGCFSLPAGSDGKFTVTTPAATPTPAAGIGGRTVETINGAPTGQSCSGGSCPIDHFSGVKPQTPGSAPACSPSLMAVTTETMSPGKTMRINGCLGGAKGTVTFRTAGGTLGPVEMLEWHNEWTVVQLPANLSGVKDQPFDIELITAAGVKLGKNGLKFVAERETRSLKLSDFDTASYKHGDAVWRVVRGKGDSFRGHTCQSTVCVEQKMADIVNTVPQWSLEEDDVYKITLANGWVYQSHDFANLDSGADFLPVCILPTAVGPKPKLSEAKTTNPLSFRVHQKWLGCLAWTAYELEVKVTGPRGVPLK